MKIEDGFIGCIVYHIKYDEYGFICGLATNPQNETIFKVEFGDNNILPTHPSNLEKVTKV